MTIVVTGSIASDYLMQFPGRFTEQFIDGQLDHVSLSFLVDDLHIYRGGVAGNIAFGLGRLGIESQLVAAVGADFTDYREWLQANGVRTEHVAVSTTRHTARFLCTTDSVGNQIASFYSGAMAEAADIDLAGVLSAIGDASLVVIAPNDPAAMLSYTRTCRDLDVPFVADPSQQLARMSGPEIRDLVAGATVLFTNEYERDLLLHKTEWTREQVLALVGSWVTTAGSKGVEIATAERTVTVAAHAELNELDPTGVGDAFRSGYLAALLSGLPVQRAAEIGCTLAGFVLESVGTQEYTFSIEAFSDRVEWTYGSAAAGEARSFLLSCLAQPVV